MPPEDLPAVEAETDHPAVCDDVAAACAGLAEAVNLKRPENPALHSPQSPAVAHAPQSVPPFEIRYATRALYSQSVTTRRRSTHG